MKEGALNNSWEWVWTGDAIKVVVNSPRVGVMRANGEARVKEGPLNAAWVIVYSGVSDLQLN